MDWSNLFSTTRLNEKKPTHYGLNRSAFDTDFDRIVFSSAFRRLQDKTQVIPLPESDFVHSRLTHSLEVSCVGRSLGRIVGQAIKRKYKLKKIAPSDFGAVVAAACLAHDIGNPPFGHSGEGAISEYFRNGKGTKFEAGLNDTDKWKDLINFEGNANGFRLLTNTKSSTGGAIKLTYTTLAAFTKYPCKSNKTDKKLEGRASQGKFGFFQSETEQFESIFNELGILHLSDGNWCRHPLAFLVEAADDICYRIIDFEDGVRIGLVAFQEAERKLKAILPKRGKMAITKVTYEKIKEEKEKIGYLRSKVINCLIYQVAALYIKNEESILAGKYDVHLTEHLPCSPVLEEIKHISISKIYKSRPVLQIEIAGFSVVAELLDLFITAVNDVHAYGNKTKDKKLSSWKIYSLLPKQYLGPDGKPEGDLYLRILQICEFVAGMTDSYAMTLYKRLKGIELPHE